ncbi:MAG: HupE/UreJ family protein [Halieaceae bacterium]|jgi:hypothetical protein|nr:HupE/UreJ family protein [Halieaceae bacterium]
MRCGLLFILLLLAPGSLLAHSLGESYGVLRAGQASGSFTVTYNMRRDQFLQLADLRYYADQTPLEIVAEEVRERYQLYSAGARCERARFAATETEAFLSASFVARCAGDGPTELRNDAFFELLPDHLHFVRASGSSGAFVGERVLDRANRQWTLPETASASLTDIAWRYLTLGVGHMAFGFDHLAFLASILLLVGGVKALVLAITGFTLGHSITLALAVLGLAIPDGQLVEALIGLTIALVAAESVFQQQARLGVYAAGIVGAGATLCVFSALGAGPDPLTMAGITLFFGAYLLLARERPAWTPGLTPLLTIFFGLIHGFGFAGSLLEIGLPVERLAVALFVFNLGIELGQLVIVGALLSALLLLRRAIPALGGIEAPARHMVASALVALGTFWFVERGFS